MSLFLIALGFAAGASLSLWAYRSGYKLGKQTGFKYGSHEQMVGRLREVKSLRELNHKLMEDHAAIISEFYGAGLEAYRG